MTEKACLEAAIISGVIAVVGLGFSFGSVYLTYKLAMATLMKQDKNEPH